MKEKQMLRLLLVFTLAIIVFTACKKDDKKTDDPKNPVKPDPATVTDIDGNTHKTVRIGTQLWMAENLRTTRFNDGTPIPTTDPPDLNISGNTHAIYQWITMYDTTLLKDLGRVYSYGAGSHPIKNVCPEGWRVPAKQDWVILSQFLGGSDWKLYGGHVLMEANSPYWEPKLWSQAQEPNNETGFTARGAGQRLEQGGDWYVFKKEALFMMSDVIDGLSIDHATSQASLNVASSSIKHIRCIMD